jgi:hypothetical protein
MLRICTNICKQRNTTQYTVVTLTSLTLFLVFSCEQLFPPSPSVLLFIPRDGNIFGTKRSVCSWSKTTIIDHIQDIKLRCSSKQLVQVVRPCVSLAEKNDFESYVAHFFCIFLSCFFPSHCSRWSTQRRHI